MSSGPAGPVADTSRTGAAPAAEGPRRRPRRWTRALEWLAIVLCSLALTVAVIWLASGGPLAGRDTPQLAAPSAPVGTIYPDQGDAHLAPGSLHPAYDSDPPTSGPHVPEPVLRDEAPLSDDQLLQALQVGDVVIMYGTPSPPPPLRRLARALAPAFSPGLAAAGHAVILAPRPGTPGVIALAWTRMVRVPSPADPRLREFARQWLGRGVGGAVSGR